MHKEVLTFLRRATALTLLTYFVLPALPGVSLSGNLWSALAVVLLIYIDSLGDLILVSLVLWFFTIIGTGFSFDFKMKTKEAIAPLFLAALFLAELPAAAHHSGLLTFAGTLPMFASALAMALTTLAVSWFFDEVLFDLNVGGRKEVTGR